MMNSFEIRELENKIIELLNEANIPLEVKRLVVFNIAEKVEKAADEDIKAQLIMQAQKTERAGGEPG